MKKRRGTISVEYMLVLAFVVIPLAALTPMILNMLRQYAVRTMSLIGLPFP